MCSAVVWEGLYCPPALKLCVLAVVVYNCLLCWSSICELCFLRSWPWGMKRATHCYPACQVTPKLKASGKLDLGKVTVGNPSWPTFTPQSSYVLYAELAALEWLHSHGRWHLADKLWWAALLPEKQLVVDSDESYFLVLKVFDMAALLWPVEFCRPGVLTWGRPSQLSWHFATKQSDFRVQPCRVVSPLVARAAAPGLPLSDCLQVAYHAVGEPEDLLKYQGSCGFLNVSEAVLQHVIAEVGVEMDPLAKGEEAEDAMEF